MLEQLEPTLEEINKNTQKDKEVDETPLTFKEFTYGEMRSDLVMSVFEKIRKWPLDMTDQIELKRIFKKMQKESSLFVEQFNETLQKIGTVTEETKDLPAAEQLFRIDPQNKEQVEAWHNAIRDLELVRADSGMTRKIDVPPMRKGHPYALTFNETLIVERFLNLPKEWYELDKEDVKEEDKSDKK